MAEALPTTEEKRTPKTAPAPAPDWLEDIEEGGISDWDEGDPSTPGGDALAGVLQQIGLTIQASPAIPASSPSAAAPAPAVPAGRILGTTEADSLREQLRAEQERRRELERLLDETQKALANAAVAADDAKKAPKKTVPERPISPVFDSFGKPLPAPPPPPPDPLARLREEIAEARRRVEKEREELEREEAEEARHEAHPVAPLLVVPIGFLGFDGRTVIARSCFAAGKGEALHRLLGSFLQQWSRYPYPPMARITREGLVVALPRDPQQRSIRIMPTGAIFLQMGPQYVRYLRTLPPIVSHRGHAHSVPKG